MIAPDMTELSFLWRQRSLRTSNEAAEVYEQCAAELDMWLEWLQKSKVPTIQPSPDTIADIDAENLGYPASAIAKTKAEMKATAKKICSIKTCPNVVKARGLCKKHYQQKWTRGEYQPNTSAGCIFPGCTNGTYRGLDWCRPHYELKRDHPAEYERDVLIAETVTP